MIHSQRKKATAIALLLLSFFLNPPTHVYAEPFPGICGDGTGIPPFLSSGAKPNLLMVLDNSGSMLDMAYVDETAGGGKCSDNSYDNTQTYAGLFEPDTWYRWAPGERQWLNGESYSAGDIVYTEGVFYRATNAGISTGTEITFDENVTWQRIGEIPLWTNGDTYAADSFVQYEHQLYHTPAGGTANDTDSTDGISIDDDAITWNAVDTTWLNGHSYSTGDIIHDRGMLYRAANTAVSSGTGRADDSGVNWVRVDEGYFEATTFNGALDADTFFLGQSGTTYLSNDIYLKITEVGGEQSGVTAFAATGNLLNWASASKFDIQKQILTGGKYNEEFQETISQSRGCSSRGFVKEVQAVNQGDGSTDVVSFSVRGFSEENWVSTSDDTTRIAILGVTDNGFVGSAQEQACQNAIDEVDKGENANQGQLSQYVDDCLAYTGANNIMAESNAAYNHSIHTCWSAIKQGYDEPSDFGNVSEIYNSCENIYSNGVPPASIEATNSGYVCYGVYNSTIPDAHIPTGNGSDRLGYVGRCWETGAYAPGCEPLKCSDATDALGAPLYSYNTGSPRCLDDGLVYECSGNYNSQRDTCNKPWTLVTQDADPTDGITCDTSAPSSPGFWTDDGNPNTALGCVQEAMWDYCGSLSIPEVIDPSEQLFSSGESWGMPGAMVDYGIVAMFGRDRPLLVMKGYIKQTETPEGILDDVADELRIGAMAFNQNGAETECTISLSSTDDTIDRFCPDQNRDGASVIAGIKDGNSVTNLTAPGSTHLEDLKSEINEIRATAWTPLAEAIYNALGYYGQNDQFRLDSSDFDISAADDPVQYWCQENYVLMITEGASTADLHTDVADKITALAAAGVSDGTIDAASETECRESTDPAEHDLFGSTYLDDLTYFGQHAHDAGIYTTPTMTTIDGIVEQKRNITTYMVTTGTPRNQTVGANAECNPYQLMTNSADNGGTSLYTGNDPEQLEANLKDVFSDILSRVSAGSAASVISSSRSGEGAVYQAIFWPEINRAVGEDPLLWVGDVHAFFIDESGRLWDDYSANSPGTVGELWSEDTDGDGILDVGEDKNNNNVLDGDRRIITFYNQVANSTQICFNPTVQATGTCSASDYFNTPLTVDLRDFDAYLWSVKNNLDTVVDYSTNRGTIVNADPLLDGTWDFRNNYRYIFTWNDLDNDGIVDYDYDDSGAVDDDGDAVADRIEVLPFVSDMALGATVTPAVNPRQDVISDFNMTDNSSLNKLIEWLRGNDGDYETDLDGDGILDAAEDINGNGVRDYVFRCRKTDCDPSVLNSDTWLLGDVIHSTPTLVGRPAEGYHFIYQDTDYARFYRQYRNRRHVIYFGGNDGMLHAVNGGFYQAGLNKFLPCRADQRNLTTGECSVSAPYNTNPAYAYPALGDELWAYIPYNLQPHLSCLTDPYYDHKYFVDGPPRVFDVRIFPDDDIHPGGWGTILVGYMRFGGAPEEASDSTTVPASPNRKFTSAYFILDITDPERPPTLLAEMTMNDDIFDYGSGPVARYVDLGYTTAMPTMVMMRADDGTSEWFLLLGNGPTTVGGENSNQGRVAVVPLNSITGVNWHTNGTGTYDPTDRHAFRIPNRPPVSTLTNDERHFGRFMIPADSNGVTESFTGDLVTVDFDINSEKITAPTGVVPYKSDAVYFGTVDGAGFQLNASGLDYWDGDGRLYRLVTRSTSIDALSGTKSQDYTYPASWTLNKMVDAQGPITAAPNIGYDDSNFWIYFGTGRFFDAADKTDDSLQYFFGVKEPYNSTCEFSWDPINWYSGGSPISTDPTASPGSQGLLRTDPVRVIERISTSAFSVPGDYVYCDDSGTPCTLPLTPVASSSIDNLNTYYSFDDLEDYIEGEKCGAASDTSRGIDGWYRHFYDARERSLGMPTLLGGLVTYTSYQPFADLCKAEGVGYLYGVYYKTGTAWYENVFGTYNDSDSKTIVKARLSLGKGLATTPSLQVGTGPDDAKAFIQTSTGEIIEVGQETLPINNFKSGRTSWRMK